MQRWSNDALGLRLALLCGDDAAPLGHGRGAHVGDTRELLVAEHWPRCERCADPRFRIATIASSPVDARSRATIATWRTAIPPFQIGDVARLCRRLRS